MSARFSITAALEHYGAEGLHPGPGWRKIKCVVHDEDQPSSSYNEEHGSFRCFACAFSGDAIDLVMEKEGIGYAEAVQFCNAEFGEEDGGLSPASASAGRRRPTRITDGGRAAAPAPPPGGRRRPRRV